MAKVLTHDFFFFNYIGCIYGYVLEQQRKKCENLNFTNIKIGLPKIKKNNNNHK